LKARLEPFVGFYCPFDFDRFFLEYSIFPEEKKNKNTKINDIESRI